MVDVIWNIAYEILCDTDFLVIGNIAYEILCDTDFLVIGNIAYEILCDTDFLLRSRTTFYIVVTPGFWPGALRYNFAWDERNVSIYLMF